MDDIFDLIAHNIVKDYDDINYTTIKACYCRNNYQVKSGMMHLGKHKTYLTSNPDTKRCHTFNIGCCHLTKLI